MHKEVKIFLSELKEKYPDYFNNKRVLELGSLNINGSPREFFTDCDYIGIDRVNGKGVDVVIEAHKYKTDKKFDVIITTEMLEHDKYADLSIENAKSLLKKGGVIIGTAANIHRKIHFERCGKDRFYKNISREQVKKWGAQITEEDNKQEDIRFIIKK
jgi:hypothetical protein